METVELRYFLGVAKSQNMHKASKSLHISPSAISKAITRLEHELEVKLFDKVGRNIKITESGLKLIKDASEMLALEKKIVESYNKNRESIAIRIIGAELPLARWSPMLIQRIQKKFIDASFSIEPVENEKALPLIEDYSADFAILASPSKLKGKMYKKLADVEFKTFVSEKHSLGSRRGSIPVTDLLKEKFVVSDPGYFGLGIRHGSPDGWRDDKFKRERVVETKSLKCLESLLHEGIVISYLPEYYGKSLGLKQLKISGCPYNCLQEIYLVRSKYSLDSVWSLI